MKNLCFAFLASAGLIAMTGCSEFTGNPNTTTTTSATLSTDSKDMTGQT
jgi:hypothetical protein